jgi:hypothetical protein
MDYLAFSRMEIRAGLVFRYVTRLSEFSENCTAGRERPARIHPDGLAPRLRVKLPGEEAYAVAARCP